jgi:transposase
MRATTLLTILLGMKHVRVTGFEITEVGLVLDVAPTTRVPCCSGCFCKVARIYDHYPGRLWRHVDFGGMRIDLRYSTRRVDCPRCGVRVELVPWADPMSAFTRVFEEHVAWCATRMDKTSIAGALRIAWETVGRIIARVVDRLGPADRLDGLTRIGVDELSYRRHREYITVIVDHTTGDIVWARPGKNAATLNAFFADLGPERRKRLDAVTLDLSGAYIKSVTENAPQAQLVFDRFHVQKLAHDALDQVRRAQVREAEDPEQGQVIKKTRFALQKNPWNLNDIEREKLALVQAKNKPLYRAYLLKETLAAVLDGRQINVARQKLEEWLAWAARSKLRPFVRVARTIRSHLDGVLAYVATGLSNGRSEGTNGKARTITRRAYGFHNPHSLIGMLFLCCSRVGDSLMPLRTYPLARAAAHPL